MGVTPGDGDINVMVGPGAVVKEYGVQLPRLQNTVSGGCVTLVKRDFLTAIPIDRRWNISYRLVLTGSSRYSWTEVSLLCHSC